MEENYDILVEKALDERIKIYGDGSEEKTKERRIKEKEEELEIREKIGRLILRNGFLMITEFIPNKKLSLGFLI